MMYGNAIISNYPTAHLANVSGATRKMVFPVVPSQYIYSHFKHVSGTPAADGSRGITVTKLKVLDVLIDQLAELKKKGDPSFGAAGPMSDERIDALIEQYETQIRSARAASRALPYLPMPSAPAGAVFSLVA